MPAKQIPDIVVGRLPIYLRELSFLAAEGVAVTSSFELAKRLGVSAAQIRKTSRILASLASREPATTSATCEISSGAF